MGDKDILYTGNKYVKKGQVKISTEYKAKIIIGRIIRFILAIILLGAFGYGIYIGMEGKVRLPDGHLVKTEVVDYRVGQEVVVNSKNKLERFLDTYKYYLSLEEATLCKIEHLPLEVIQVDNTNVRLQRDEYLVNCGDGKTTKVLKKNILGAPVLESK